MKKGCPLHPRASIAQPDDLSIRLIPLTRGMVAVVDTEDYERVARHLWFVWDNGRGNIYAGSHVEGKMVRMHTFITGVLEIDHWDGNGLNNRRKNLRSCSDSQNMANQRLSSRNRSGVKGVYRDGSRWCASMMVDKRTRFLGSFRSKEAAAAARLAFAKKTFGEFARV